MSPYALLPASLLHPTHLSVPTAPRRALPRVTPVLLALGLSGAACGSSGEEEAAVPLPGGSTTALAVGDEESSGFTPVPPAGSTSGTPEPIVTTGDEATGGMPPMEGGDESSTGPSGPAFDCELMRSFDGTGDIGRLNDEFDEPATMCSWFFRADVEGEEPQIQRMDIDEASAGHLVIIPTTSGWFGDYTGPYLYKEIEGDFVVETHVSATSLQNPGEAPTLPFSSAGLVVRNPDHGPLRENWIMFDVGRQATNVALEWKNTIESQSDLITRAAPHVGTLRICRLGSTFILSSRMADETEFEVRHEYERPDLPPRLQVGLVTTAWNGTGSDPDFDLEPDVRGEWDYVRFFPAQTREDCHAE